MRKQHPHYYRLIHLRDAGTKRAFQCCRVHTSARRTSPSSYGALH